MNCVWNRSPTKTWRKWHRKVNVDQRRFALCSALAASAVPALVMARGHRVGKVPEIPLVVATAKMTSLPKTKDAVALLEALGAGADLARCAKRKLRAGRGKMRNRRYERKLGPLVIFNEKGTLTRAFRNIPGVDLVSVTRLNLLKLAPGGHVGRFVVWTQDAFERLDALYGTTTTWATEKKVHSFVCLWFSVCQAATKKKKKKPISRFDCVLINKRNILFVHLCRVIMCRATS